MMHSKETPFFFVGSVFVALWVSFVSISGHIQRLAVSRQDKKKNEASSSVLFTGQRVPYQDWRRIQRERIHKRPSDATPVQPGCSGAIFE
jgi:hypothetical protein